MKILEIVPSIQEEASGPSYSVPQLAHSLAELGHDVHLMSVGGMSRSLRVSCRQSQFPNDWPSVPVIRTLWLSKGLKAAVRAEASDADIVHTHGLWAAPNVVPAFAAVRAGASYIFSPRGTLGEAALQFSAIRKRLFWAVWQGRAARLAKCIHATSETEYAEIRAFGLRQPVSVIPNGISLPERPSVTGRSNASRTLLYLGRLHPKKGLDVLLEAWARVTAAHPDWTLRIVGPGEARYVSELETIVARDGIARVNFDGAIYGAEKQQAYRDADLFVLPTRNENFGMTVAEALAQGTPVISTTGAPWEGLGRNGCGWWIDQGVEPLSRTLNEAMALDPSRLKHMGRAGRDWMEREFGWAHIAEQMDATYQWMVEGGRPPPTIRKD